MRAVCMLITSLLAMLPGGTSTTKPEPAGQFAEPIAIARRRVVKLYGATVGREKAYGSGVVISRDGRVVTVWSIMLEGRSLRVVLPDGRAFPARVLAHDEQRQLALLKIEADDLPFFELTSSRELTVGDWVIAAANPFKVAEGPEPVSVCVGVLSARANLAARHHAQDFPYDGPVLLTDALIATPGSAGGALVDARGRLVGVIGTAVISRRTNTWVNYALPVEQVAAFVNGEALLPAAPARATRPTDLGIRLFDIGGRTRPAYVERVRPASPASAAGLRSDDLIVSLNGQAVATCRDFTRIMAGLRPGQRATLVVKRGDDLTIIELMLEPPAP